MNLQDLFDNKVKETHYQSYSHNEAQRKKNATKAKDLKYWQGKTRDAETRAKISQSLSKPRPDRVKTMVTPEGVFEGGITEVALHFKVSTVTIHNWLKKYPTMYYYITKDQ